MQINPGLKTNVKNPFLLWLHCINLILSIHHSQFHDPAVYTKCISIFSLDVTSFLNCFLIICRSDQNSYIASVTFKPTLYRVFFTGSTQKVLSVEDGKIPKEPIMKKIHVYSRSLALDRKLMEITKSNYQNNLLAVLAYWVELLYTTDHRLFHD